MRKLGKSAAIVGRIGDSTGMRNVTARQLTRARLAATGSELVLRFSCDGEEKCLFGDDAMWALGLWLPRLNGGGVNEARCRLAVNIVESSGGPHRFLKGLANSRLLQVQRFQNSLTDISPLIRLALEIAANGSVEQSVTEGDLERLRREWKEAEEIASIADDLLVPGQVRNALDKMRKSVTK